MSSSTHHLQKKSHYSSIERLKQPTTIARPYCTHPKQYAYFQTLFNTTVHVQTYPCKLLGVAFVDACAEELAVGLHSLDHDQLVACKLLLREIHKKSRRIVQTTVARQREGRLTGDFSRCRNRICASGVLHTQDLASLLLQLVEATAPARSRSQTMNFLVLKIVVHKN